MIQLKPHGDGPDVWEDKLIGAVLELELAEKIEVIESAGLSRDDFRNSRRGAAWFVICRLAERRLEATAATTCSYGRRSSWLSDADLSWLEDLEQSNLCTKQQAIQIADDIRNESRKRRVRGELQAALDNIDRGRFHPGRLSGELESVMMSLATDFAVDETAEGELLRLNTAWAENAKAGKVNLDPTGIRVLDSIVGGFPENLTLIQGQRGVGKNIVLSTCVRSQLERDWNEPAPSVTGVFLLEDRVDGLLRRWQAEDLDLLIRDIGAKALTPEQWEKKARVDEHHFALLRRIVHYKHGSISRGELRRRAVRMIYHHKVRRIWVDNLKEIDHRDPRQKLEYWQGVAETTRVMRDLARDSGVPIIMLVHDTDETAKDGHEHAPDPGKVMGGQSGADRARMILGAWRKGPSLRITVTKANEISDAGIRGPTVELQRNYDAGTANPEGGRVLDLKNEEAKERREKKDRNREESVDERIAREALLKSKKAAVAAEKPAEVKPPEPPAQASLLDVPPTQKPETPTP